MSKVSLSPDETRVFAEANFPNSPERLAEYLEVEVRLSPLVCDGWWIKTETKSIIRINSSTIKTRQRFTLAHELGHLISGIPSLVGDTPRELRKALNEEEKQVNELAAELLLPTKVVQELVKTIPITAKDIKRISKKSKTSEVFVARRLASLADTIGLKACTVAFYKADKFAWQWPENPEVKMPHKVADIILHKCVASAPNPARLPLKNKDIAVACLLENPSSEMKTVFIQIVDEQHGIKKLDEELVHELQEIIFAGDNTFKQSLQGCFGYSKPIILEMTLEEAVKHFNKTYTNDKERWSDEFRSRLLSENGQNYIRVRL